VSLSLEHVAFGVERHDSGGAAGQIRQTSRRGSEGRVQDLAAHPNDVRDAPPAVRLKATNSL
jgi:hypothetical protein